MGFIASLPRPGGNVTGVLHYEATIVGKWLAMLREIAPHLTRAALLANPEVSSYQYFLRSAAAAAPSLGIDLTDSPVQTAADIERAIEELARSPNNGLILPPDASTIVHRDLIVALAAWHRLPAVYALDLRRGRRPHVLRDRSERHVSAGCFLCRPHPAWRQTGRLTGSGSDEVRDDCQSQDCQGTCSLPPTR
jgi:ABC transporter substrate binding protein